MAFCISCGNDLTDGTFCTNCGTAATGEVQIVPDAPKANLVIADMALMEPSKDVPPLIQNSNKKKLILWLSIAATVILFITAIATAEHWEKIDVPAHAETFHTETYLTGNFDIVDDNVSPCYIRQSWVGCTNVYVAIYNATCASYPLTDSAQSYCSSYLSMIYDMQSQSWSYLASIGNPAWGTLGVVAEEATMQVSNNDYRAAETHSAVCYLGFLGECN
jgi:hypothetical protein